MVWVFVFFFCLLSILFVRFVGVVFVMCLVSFFSLFLLFVIAIFGFCDVFFWLKVLYCFDWACWPGLFHLHVYYWVVRWVFRRRWCRSYSRDSHSSCIGFSWLEYGSCSHWWFFYLSRRVLLVFLRIPTDLVIVLLLYVLFGASSADGPNCLCISFRLLLVVFEFFFCSLVLRSYLFFVIWFDVLEAFLDVLKVGLDLYLCESCLLVLVIFLIATCGTDSV